MSHIGLEGHLEKEEEIREEGLKKKQNTKDNREARKTQSCLEAIAKNIVREKKKEEKRRKRRERPTKKDRTGAQQGNKGLQKSR